MGRLTWIWSWLLLIWIVSLRTTNATAHLSGPLHPSRKDRLLHQVPTWTEPRQVLWTPRTSRRTIMERTKERAWHLEAAGRQWPSLRRVQQEGEHLLPPPHPVRKSAQTVTPSQQRDPSAGPRPASGWRAPTSTMRWNACTPSTGRSSKQDTCQASPRQAVLPDSDARRTSQAGDKCRQKPDKGSQASGWRNGSNTNLLQLMRNEDDDSPDDPDRRAQLRELSKPGTPFRPRSCRALNFQKPCHLHPYARPTFPKQRRKCQKQRMHPWSGCPAPEQGDTIPRVIGPASDSHSTKSHPKCRRPKKSTGLSGPNSGDCRQIRPALRALLLVTVGARVSSAAAVTEDGPGLRPGKLHGRAHQGREPNHPTRHMKRAFNRACRRANQSLQEGTWYRNRWHTRATLDALRSQPPPTISRVPRTARRHYRNSNRPDFSFRVLTWNAGGLSAALTQELMAWCDTCSATEQYDAIIITETHWKHVDDYRSGHWLCVHSTGHTEEGEVDRYAGILCLLSSKCFDAPRIKEHVKGRLLQVTATHIRSQMPTCFIGIYQHVWRPHLSAARNRALRSHIWQSLQSLITATPARHQLIVAGDFNATLTSMHPHIGPSVPKPSSHSNLDKDLQTLIQECDLCALNTWHSRPTHTYASPSVQSQLDYILMRSKDANHQAKLAMPLHSFPVGAYRQTTHYPVQATVRLLPMAYRAPQLKADHRFEATALQSAVSQHSDSAQALQQAVEARLLALPTAQALCDEHDLVNTILLEETCRAFPPAKKKDQRVSAHEGYRASARGTWQLHRQLHRSGLPSLRNIWSRWRLYALFLRASAQLRRQSKDLKRQFLEDQLRQAESAARKGNHRDLFLIARRLGPKKAQGVSRLQGPDGHVLDSKAEMAAIIKHSTAAFASTPDTTSLQPLRGSHSFTATELQAELGSLNIRKAVPRHIAPNAVWKLCAASVSNRLGPCFEHHFRPLSTDKLEGDLQDAHICWLDKPSKPPTTMSAKRPIGLMPPCAKSLAGNVARHILEHLQPMLDHMPQFAYCAGRGVNDAILRVHSYFGDVEHLQKGQITNRFKMHQGVKPLLCHGGLCLSLDLSSAFDSVSRDLLIQSLIDHQVPSDLINMVQQLHRNARYIFRTSTAQGLVTTTNGIKQGCRAAPTLWVSFTLSVLEHLARQRSLAWVQNILTLFADDFCGHWTISSLQDWTAAVSDLTLLLETLETYQLKVNLQKTALLLNLKGKIAKKLLRQHTRQKAGEIFLILTVHGQERLLKIRESHTYLGTIISYRDRRDLNVSHRISAAQTRYQQLRKILNGRGPLSIKYRLRLWQACIPPCLTYSLEVTGCTTKGLQRLKTIATRHVRAILREPAHLHHVSTSDIWERAKLPVPELSILARMTKLYERREPMNCLNGPDLVTNDKVVDQLSILITGLQEAIQRMTTHGLTPPEEAQQCINRGFPCPHCNLVQPTAHARSISHGHQAPRARHTGGPQS